MSGGHGQVDPSNRNIAMLISVLALVLAISETLGKAAQTNALNVNVEAANLWNFFQAKTIRSTVLKTAAEELEALAAGRCQSAPVAGAGLREPSQRRAGCGGRASRVGRPRRTWPIGVVGPAAAPPRTILAAGNRPGA